MERKIRIGAVSYLNTLPLVYGMKDPAFRETADVIFEYPSMLAESLMTGRVDVALLPVAMIPEIKNAQIISDYCIGATSDVASVCLFSDVPLHEIKRILLDYQSRTSVALTRLLVKEHWKLDVEFISAEPGYEAKISGTDAGLVIGDRAFFQRKKSKYIYDLAGEWIDHTGLPFVFAAWISTFRPDENFLKAFNAANAKGFEHLPEIIKQQAFDVYDLDKYYTEDISYTLDARKREGLDLFLKKIK